MIVICYGMIKSASTFTYNIVNQLIKEDARQKALNPIEPKDLSDDLKFNFIDGRIDLPDVRKLLLNADPNFLSTRHIVFKTHMPKSYFQDDFSDNELVSISNYRHPVEVALSLRDAAIKDKKDNKNRFDKFDTFDAALSQVPYQIKCFESWLGGFNVFYDDLILRPMEVFEDLLVYLNLDQNLLVVAEELLAKKANVAEYNIAKLGRRFDELSSDSIEKYENEFNSFIELINSLKN